MSETSVQYDSSIAKCREIFEKKTHDYGSAWRILRTSSLTDQLFIKAQRIRTIEQGVKQKVEEGIEPEFIGIVNYAIMAIIQLRDAAEEGQDLPLLKVQALYDECAREAKALMEAKNNDYGEAWRDMRISSFTDLILMKLLRIKQIEDLGGETLISEGIDANYFDIVNYAIFALIKLEQKS